MERVTAETQFDDLTGTIAIDGWQHLMAADFGGWPKGYRPVGVQIYAEPLNEGESLDLSCYALVVDESILDGTGPDAVRKYAKLYRQVPVFRYEAKRLDLAKLLPRIKRLSIVLQDQTAEDTPLMLAGDDVIYRGGE